MTLAAAVLSSGTLGRAQSIAVPDFSFESPAVPGTYQDNSGIGVGSAIPGTGDAWYYLGGFIQSGSPVGVQDASANGFTAGANPDGTQVGYVNNGAWMGSTALTIVQPNTTYTLTVSEGNRGGGFAQSAGFSLALAFGSTAGDPGLTNSASWGNSLHVDYANSPAVGTFGDYTVSFTTGASGGAVGQSLFVLLGSDANTGSFANPIDYDDVRLTAVPEPSVIALAMGGLVMLAFGRRFSFRS